MHVVIFYESDCGGETVATESLIRALKKNSGIKISPIKLHRLTNYSLRNYAFWIIKSVYISFVIIVRYKPSIVYTTTYTAGCAAILYRILSPVKICFHYHGSRVPPKVETLSFKKRLTQKVKSKLVWKLHYYFLKRVNILITPTLYTLKSLKSEFSLELVDKTAIIPAGFDKSIYFMPTLKQVIRARKNYGIKLNSKVLAYVGRLDPHKQIEKLINLISTFSDLRYRLIIAYPPIGSNIEIETLNKIMKLRCSLGLENRIILLNNPEPLRDIYYCTAAVVSLSTHENFPQVMLEAFACGTLFLSSYLPSVESFLLSLDNRLVATNQNHFKFRQQVQSILKLTPREKNKIISKAQKKIKDMEWSRVSGIVSNSFENLID